MTGPPPSTPAFRPVAAHPTAIRLAAAFRPALADLAVTRDPVAGPTFTFLGPATGGPAYRVEVRLSPRWVWQVVNPPHRSAGPPPATRPPAPASPAAPADRLARLCEIHRVLHAAAEPAVAPPPAGAGRPALIYQAPGAAPAAGTSPGRSAETGRAGGLSPERPAGPGPRAPWRPVALPARFLRTGVLNVSPHRPVVEYLSLRPAWSPPAESATGRPAGAPLPTWAPFRDQVGPVGIALPATPDTPGVAAHWRPAIELHGPGLTPATISRPVHRLVITHTDFRTADTRGGGTPAAVAGLAFSEGVRAGLTFGETVPARHRRTEDPTAVGRVPEPVPMTVRPPSAAPTPPVVVAGPAAAPPAPPGPGSPAGPPPGLPADLLQRLTEQVVRSLDARSLAARERLGGY